MRRLKISLGLLLLIIISVIFSGCWNYREINEMAIVSALAIDKDSKSKQYNLAVEVIHAEHSGTGGSIRSKVYKSKGDTLFEAVRDLIPEVGRRGFWSHAKVVIISKTLAESDITPVLDWLYRDQELRRDLNIFISKGPTAAEILMTDPELENTVGFNLNSVIKNQGSTNRFPKLDLGNIVNNFSMNEKSCLVPLVGCQGQGLNKTAAFGSAILKKDKVVGYISGEDTFNALWVQGKVKTGTFVVKDFVKPGTEATIEIFSSSTKSKAAAFGDGVKIVVNISADVGMAEISDNVPFQKSEQQKKIKETIEKSIVIRLTNTIKKIQSEYKADVFNFESKVRIYAPKYYKKISLNWGEEFSNVPVEIMADVHIRGSAVKSKQIKGSD